MIAVIDTNFIVKYFIGSKDVGIESKNIFENNNTFLIIPSIVLVELKYLMAKNKLSTQTLGSTEKLLEAGNCMVYPLDQNLIDYIPTELNIHDGIIYATAKIQTNNFKEPIYILTKDKEIKKLEQESIKIIW